jgi:translation initiation factor 5A
MSEIDTSFEKVEENSEKVYPLKAGDAKKGLVIMLQNFPCKVIETSTSKTGKHGHAKINIIGVDIFTGKKYTDMAPTSHNIYAPFVTTTNWQLVDITDDKYAVLINENGESCEHIMIPDENSADSQLAIGLYENFKKDKNIYVTVTKAMDTESITAFKLVE